MYKYHTLILPSLSVPFEKPPVAKQHDTNPDAEHTVTCEIKIITI